MSSNKRNHIRTALQCQIKIWHESFGERVVTTRDISDGGVFLMLENEEQDCLATGLVLQGQVQGLMDQAPIVSMEVVRIEPAGIGLRFLSQ